MGSIRQIADRLTRVYSSATPDERKHGEMWIPQANAAARLLSAVTRQPISVSAAVLAALSPLNRWEDNVTDAFRLARDRSARVRTSHANRIKAIRILDGDDPNAVLSGGKVRAFWAQIAEPNRTDHSLAIGRRLYRAATGVHHDNRSAAPRSSAEYAKIESAFRSAANRIGVPVSEFAATVWVVMRRGQRGQRGIEWGVNRICEPDVPPCCSSPRLRPRGSCRGRRQYRCVRCNRVLTARVPPVNRLRLVRTLFGWCQLPSTDGLPIWYDANGRAHVTVHPRHPYANSGGYQRLARFLMAEALNRPLRTDEHTHHLNGDLTDDRLSNLALVAAAYHGSVHASAVFVARTVDGRFAEIEDPAAEGGEVGWPRREAVMGYRAVK